MDLAERVMQSCGQWPFHFKSNVSWEANAGLVFQFLFPRLLPPTETKLRSLFSALRLQTELDAKPCLWVTFFSFHGVISGDYFCCRNKALFSILQKDTSYSSGLATNQKLGLTWLNKELNCKPWNESVFLQHMLVVLQMEPVWMFPKQTPWGDFPAPLRLSLPTHAFWLLTSNTSRVKISPVPNSAKGRLWFPESAVHTQVMGLFLLLPAGTGTQWDSWQLRLAGM